MIMQFAIIRLKISLRMRSLYEMRPCIGYTIHVAIIHMYVIESVCGKGQGGKTVSKPLRPRCEHFYTAPYNY